MPEKKDRDQQREMYVVQSNELIRMKRFKLTAQQQKLVLYAISKIKKDDPWYTQYEFSVREICDVCGLKIESGGWYYAALKEQFEKLVAREFVVMPDGSMKTISWIGDVSAKPAEGIIRISFNQNMQPYLFDLKERYTQYQLKDVLVFKHVYSMRLFEILRSYTTAEFLSRGVDQEKTFELEELRGLLGLSDGRYREWKDFERYVLRVSVNEINKYATDMQIAHKGNRVGRRIVSVTFIVGGRNRKEKLSATLEQRRRLREIDEGKQGEDE